MRVQYSAVQWDYLIYEIRLIAKVGFVYRILGRTISHFILHSKYTSLTLIVFYKM